MNPITWLKDYTTLLEDEFSEINSSKMVIDSSELTKRLDAHQSDFNMLLVGVVPDVSSKGTSADDYKEVFTTQLMVLKKTSYSEIDYDEFYEIFKEAYDVAKKISLKMLADSSSGCNGLRQLNVNSIQIIPIWNLSACNGCNILFNFDANI